MNQGQVSLGIDAGVASIVFDRPQARNAMTWRMYEQLETVCEQLQTEANVRAVFFRGAGGEAFVAGTDIEQFRTFQSGEDGVQYERKIEHCIGLLEALPMPTIAVIEGWAVGGGLIIAAACDFRLATAGARLGVPIARTLGNCLSVANMARLVADFGAQRVKRMLLLAEILNADEALACGFLNQICDAFELDAVIHHWCQRLAALAPVTQSIAKESLRRLVAHGLPVDDDLIRRGYGSHDFHEGVDAFVAKRSPVWSGR